MPAILGQPLRIHSRDGQTGAPIHLTVTPSGVESVDPAGAVVSFLTPGGAFGDDVVVSFCHKVLLFTGRDTAHQWIANHPDPLFDLSVADAFEIGRRVTVQRYGDELSAVTVSPLPT